MIKENITLDEMIEFLNELVKIDQMAMDNLIEHREICNEEMADHPTVQVQAYDKEGVYRVGLLGILNGMFGIDEDGWGAMAAVFDEFELVKFARTNAVRKKDE